MALANIVPEKWFSRKQRSFRQEDLPMYSLLMQARGRSSSSKITNTPARFLNVVPLKTHCVGWCSRLKKNAYEIASAKLELRRFIPEFYGGRNVTQVVSQDGRDITDAYLVDCCLELQKLEGVCVKFESVRDRFRYVETLFNQAGICYTKDMSAFLDADGIGIKIIDFATRDAYAETERQWIIEGRIE